MGLLVLVSAQASVHRQTGPGQEVKEYNSN